MCPLERANTDSDCASWSRSRPSSRTVHASTGKRPSGITVHPRPWWRRRGSSRRADQLREIGYDDVGAVLYQGATMRGVEPVDAYDVAEAAGTSGRDAGERVLEHGRLIGSHAEQLRPGKERVRRRLAGQVPLDDRAPVDASLHQPVQAGDVQYLSGVSTGRHDRPGQPGVPGDFEVAPRPFVDRNAVAVDALHQQLVLAVADAVDGR